MQKKMINWVLAATLICNTNGFIACSPVNDDNPANMPTFTPQPGDTWDAETRTLTVNSNPGNDAYRGRTEIASVVFGNAVTSIGDRAFYDCHIGVVDIPASVVSIGSEAFAGDDSELYVVTIHATDCSFGTHPFVQSIMTDIYVPEEFVGSYMANHPDYAKQIWAIPEAWQEGHVIVWSEDLCEYIWVMIPNISKGKIIPAHNTQGGITVTYTGAVDEEGFYLRDLALAECEKLTFTSAVGNISQITVKALLYNQEDEEPDTPIAEGWTWDASKRTFTWQGLPAATVEMFANGEIDLENVQISFTVN